MLLKIYVNNVLVGATDLFWMARAIVSAAKNHSDTLCHDVTVLMNDEDFDISDWN